MSHAADRLDSPEGRSLRAALRRVCERLPEVTETINGFGHTAFQVRKKSFVLAGMGERGEAVAIKSDRVNQDVLVRKGPFYRTPYIGHHGWVSIDEPLDGDWAEVAALIRDGYLLAAPKRLARQVRDVDAGADGPP